MIESKMNMTYVCPKELDHFCQHCSPIDCPFRIICVSLCFTGKLQMYYMSFLISILGNYAQTSKVCLTSLSNNKTFIDINI